MAGHWAVVRGNMLRKVLNAALLDAARHASGDAVPSNIAMRRVRSLLSSAIFTVMVSPSSP